jgi:hypothetical protein
MTMLTAKKAVPACLAVPFDAKNPLPEASVWKPNRYFVTSIFLGFLYLIFFSLFFYLPCHRVILLWLHVPHFLRRGRLSLRPS